MSYQIIIGDALTELRKLPDRHVQCCITSPPHFGLCDYKVEGQIGQEKTPEAYVDRLAEVFREVRRILRDDGTLWLNLGDSYAGSGQGWCKEKGSSIKRRWLPGADDYFKPPAYISSRQKSGLKPKDLIGIPWMVAFALRIDGWYLRQDIIWHKPHPMPESVKDRCTRSHEYVFLLSKASRYYFDAQAISEPLAESTKRRYRTGWHGDEERGWPTGKHSNFSKYFGSDRAKSATTRNRRSVWTIPVAPYKGVHFATYPPALVRLMILAGCSEGGTVLDPFAGSGTTGQVAESLGRNSILIELNPKYKALIEERVRNSLDSPHDLNEGQEK